MAKKKVKKNELAQPHDATFKKLFGEIDIARDVIEKNLPGEVLEKLDLETLEKLDGSFINENLEETFSDLLYGIKINGSDAYIALLLEHKSNADKLGIFQVAGYIISAWSKIRQSGKEELPLVIPMIVYHGKAKWNYKRDIREMIPDFDMVPEYLKAMQPVLRHEFINLREYTEEDLAEYKAVTRLVLRSFKHIYDDKDKLLEMFVISVDEIGPEVADEQIHKYINILLLYYTSVKKDFSKEDISQKIHELNGKGGEIMTLLEKIEKEGIEKGIEKGKRDMVEELIRAGAEEALIVKVSKLSVEEVKNIKKEMKK